MDNTIQDISTVNYLKDEDVVFEKTTGGFLSLKVQGKEYKRVMLQRAFPLSKPAKFISVREDIAKLSAEKRALVEEELTTRYFTPIILQITKLKDERGFVYIEAETSSGSRKITAHNNSSSFIRLSAGRVLIIDVDGNRFDIPDMSLLDKKSIRNLEVVV